MLKQDRRKREIVVADRVLEQVVVAVEQVVVAVAPAGVLIVVEDGDAVVCDEQTNYLEVVEVTGVANGAVATPIVIEPVPGGVVRECEADSREVVIRDPLAEDGGCQLLSGDPGGERWREELI